MNVVYLGAAIAMMGASVAIGDTVAKQSTPEKARMARLATILLAVAAAVFALTAFLPLL